MDEQGFWGKVRKDGPGECWIWTGAVSRGYGVVRYDRRVMKAHRVAILLETGSMPPENRQVCHRCDRKLCVNPAHLYVGSVADNGADRRRPRRRIRIAI
jgi:hypothetical protein